MSKRYLTVIGDPNQINTWSNIPYFFLKAGQKIGFFDAGLALRPEKLRVERLIWNLLEWVKTGERGGFQYSPFFLRKLFAQVGLPDEPIEFISHFPLLPPLAWKHNWQINYYIDATLKQNFQDYGIAARVGKKVQATALKQEKDNYSMAQRVICMSHWAAKSVVKDYGITPEKVHVVYPGANMDEEKVDALDVSYMPPRDKIRLGFIGKDWKRKGLLYLLEIADILDTRDIPVEIVVIGPSSSRRLPRSRLIKYLGFIDKERDMQQFIHIMQSFHFGCLFSSADASPIFNLECLRLGVPVLAFRVGGIRDTVPEDLGFLFEPSSPASKVADLIENYFNNLEEYERLKKKVMSRAGEHSWRNTVDKFIKLWQGSKEFAYEPNR